jgi:MarR family transcriptional regulator for hemolysin
MTFDDICARHDAPGLLAIDAARRFTRSMDMALAPLGVSLAQLSPLMLLRREGPMSQRDLVRGSSIGQPAMVAALAKLEGAGFVTRTPDASDRRSAAIALTPLGETVVAKARPLLVGGNEKALMGFSAQETMTLQALMSRMIQNLSDGLQQ